MRAKLKMTLRAVAVAVLFSSFCEAQDRAEAELVAAIEMRWAEEGAKSARFLWENMPERDRGEISQSLLIENVNYALIARKELPWGSEIPEEVFLNDVLPYAVLDENREAWRGEFYYKCRKLVEDCETSGEAAQVLNRDFFDIIDVHYNRGRKKPNQSPSESIEQGKATCTGLSILLTYACRSVGVPARIAGTALWTDRSGNHTWVEVWHDGRWNYLGADEYDKKGLNHGWFGGRASKADPKVHHHAIWATSWKKSEGWFPMVWNLQARWVPAVNVTERYLKKKSESEKGVGIRVVSSPGGARLRAQISLEGEPGSAIETKAGRKDYNDVARLVLPGKGPWTLQVETEAGKMLTTIIKRPTEILEIVFDAGASTGSFDVEEIIEGWIAKKKPVYEAELKAKVIRDEQDREFRWLERRFGEDKAGLDGPSLFISMHGGGGTTAEANTQQWQNQIRLYQPEEGIYVAPRAPTDTWNMWHRGHIDDFIDHLISLYVVAAGVDPNRVYLMGYSAGGDGVYQLAPRMADRFAGVAMMAGHPNDARPENLRNLLFEGFMGGKDFSYNRNKKAVNWGKKMAALRDDDPEGYEHRVTIYPELGHWMQRKDAEVLPRLLAKSRQEWPKKMVWVQDNITHERLYWLGVKPENQVKACEIYGQVDGQTIRLQGDEPGGIRLWLSNELLDLSKPVQVFHNEKKVFAGKVEQKAEVVIESLQSRSGMVATALLELP